MALPVLQFQFNHQNNNNNPSELTNLQRQAIVTTKAIFSSTNTFTLYLPNVAVQLHHSFRQREVTIPLKEVINKAGQYVTYPSTPHIFPCSCGTLGFGFEVYFIFCLIYSNWGSSKPSLLILLQLSVVLLKDKQIKISWSNHVKAQK